MGLSEGQEMCGQLAAKYCKFFLRSKDPNVRFVQKFARVPEIGFYRKHQKHFDKLSAIFTKNHIDVVQYLKFFVFTLDKYERDIDKDLISQLTINQYIDHLQIRERNRMIYKYFMKSANNIVDECIELGYLTTRDYLRHLIEEKKIANYYVAGKISKYFFAAIPGFRKLIPKLDHFARDEFQILLDRFDLYNTEINQAFLQEKNCKINPIKLVDDMIFEKRNSPR